MKLLSYRLIDVDQGTPSAVVEVEFDEREGKVYSYLFDLNVRISGTYSYNGTSSPMAIPASSMSPEQYYLREVKQRLGFIITNKLFDEWEKMEKIKL